MSEIQSADMKRLVGVLGDIKKEFTRLREEIENATKSFQEFDKAHRGVEYRGYHDGGHHDGGREI